MQVGHNLCLRFSNKVYISINLKIYPFKIFTFEDLSNKYKGSPIWTNFYSSSFVSKFQDILGFSTLKVRIHLKLTILHSYMLVRMCLSFKTFFWSPLLLSCLKLCCNPKAMASTNTLCWNYIIVCALCWSSNWTCNRLLISKF